MTRISAKELVDDFFDEKFNGKVRDRSQESRTRVSPSKRAYNEDSLVFETKIVDREGVEVTVGALGMLAEEANKLSWKHFKNYMIRNGGIEKNFPRKSEVKVFYIDEEDDEIFVDTDDEYKELLKIASQKNKEGNTMILKFISVTKTRRHYGGYGDRKIDLLGREVKTSPGKVTKPSSSKHFDTVSGKIWKLNSGKNMRGKMPGKMVPLLGSVPTKPITVTVGLNEIKDLSHSLEESRITDVVPCSPRSVQSPVSHEIRKQQASVFDWISKNGQQEKDMPPSWFIEYMENYKDELTAEITAKVVHSLGIVIENKLAGFETKKTSDVKVQTKAFENKAKKPRDTKKVKKEAMRMTMEINEEPDSKELKKLKKSLIKKTDKVVKVAMKIEKKNQLEEKTRKTSLSSSSNSDIGIKLPTKKEKKESKKAKKSKNKKIKEDVQTKSEDDNTEEDTQAQCPVTLVQTYPVSPAKNYPVTPVKDYPVVKTPPTVPAKDEVVTKQPTSSKSDDKDNIFKCKTKKKMTIIDQLFSRQMTGHLNTIEIKKGDGKLANAVYISEDNRLVQQVEPEAKVQSEVKLINMGCLQWTESVTVQKTISSDELDCPESFVKLPALKPGEEGTIPFNFTAPSKTGLYESIWHFFDGKERFGPPIKFKFIVKADSKAIPLAGVEMKDFRKNPEVEMRGIGISAKSQEMVEMCSSRQDEKVISNTKKDIITITDSNHNSFEDCKHVEDEYDLLASEVDTLTIDTIETIASEDEKEDDDFEVIPVPACFNLDVPFELIEDEKDGTDATESSDESESVTTSTTSNSPTEHAATENTKSLLEEAKDAVDVIRDKLGKTTTVQLKFDASQTASVERLVELGFANRDENIKLLRESGNNLEKVLDKLYNDRGAKWAEKRH